MVRVLIADDIPSIVEMLTLFVSSMGHEVMVAYDGREALDTITSDPPKAVLLDLMMPGTDKLQAMKTVQR
jgi:two-component system alkaline phosphatase synthesis response regulator PhoP